jgi:hypothetical protein
MGPPAESVTKMLSKLGPKPQFKWLPLDELFIETKYQRSTKSRSSANNIGYLVAEFSWAACGALVVCFDPNQKKYAVIDGQHRAQAARSRGECPEIGGIGAGAE